MAKEDTGRKFNIKALTDAIVLEKDQLRAIKFLPETHIDNYLHVSESNIAIYEDLTENEKWAGLFEPLEFLNLFHEQEMLIHENTDKPTTLLAHLLNLNLEKKQLYYLLLKLDEQLLLYYASSLRANVADKSMLNCRTFINKQALKLGKELEKLEKPQPITQPSKYNFGEVKAHSDTINDPKEQIIYLTKKSTEYKQNPELEMPFVKSFGEKCDLEIKMLKDLLALEPTATKWKSNFKLSKKTGAKTDLIRVLNALYEMKFIDNENEQTPTKEEFMRKTGDFFGVDLSKYDGILSQSLNESSLEVNLKVFDEMKKITQENHYLGKEKK